MTKYVCKECGSENIQVRLWFNPNTLEAFDWVDDDGSQYCYCEDCNNVREWKIKE